MKVLAIIPAHNEQENILSLINELKQLEKPIDFVVINDASLDRTKEVLVNNNINHITHPINLGLSEAIKTGFRYALRMGYDAAIQIDGDGQHDPKCIQLLIDTMENEHLDFVQGSRFAVKEQKGTSLRMVGSRLISFVILLATFHRVKDPTNGMRLFNRKIMKRFVLENSLYVEPDTIAYLIKDKYKWKEVYVVVRQRLHGRSYLTPFRGMIYMIEVMFSILFVQAFRPKQNRKVLKLQRKMQRKANA